MKKLINRAISRLAAQVHHLSTHDEINHFFKRNNSISKVPGYKILYSACRMAEMEFLYLNELTNEIHFKTKDGLRVITDHGIWIFIEMLCDKKYVYYRDFIQDDYLIFDVGANRGYASLYFAMDEKCKNVFSFEPCKKTYSLIKRHIVLNPRQGSKIRAFNYGLSDKNENQIFQMHPEHDWVNTGNSQFINSYLDEKRKSQIIAEEVELKKASEAFVNLLDESPHLNKLQRFLKIDIEGAEYKVLADFKKSDLLRNFSVIFGECHMGIEGIIEIVKDDFTLMHLSREHLDGLFSFALVNKTMGAQR